MVINLERFSFSPNSTIGRLAIVDGDYAGYQCYTLEPQNINQSVKPRAIPLGTYAVVLRTSPRFGRLMPHLENVPDFDGVMIHWGNFPRDTEGCILVGETLGPQPDFIGESRAAFAELYSRLETGTITITNR